MDPLTGWLVGTAVFVLGLIGTACVVVSVLDERFAATMARVGHRLIERINAVHADVSDLQEDVRFAMLPANEPGDEARAKLDELAEHVAEQGEQIAIKATEAQTRVEGMKRLLDALGCRVSALEQRPGYDDGELLTEVGQHMLKLRVACQEDVENLRKRTAEKLGRRDRKIEDLYGRVGVLIERTDVLAEAAVPKPCKSTERSTAPAEKKPSRKRIA